MIYDIPCFCAGLEICATVFFCDFSRFGLLCLAVFPQISFVANKELLNVIVGMLGNILHPVLYVFECFLVRYIIYQNNAMRAFVKCARDDVKPLLSRSIPYLALYTLALHVAIMR